MTVLGIRFCTVKPEKEARDLAAFFGSDGWNFSERGMSTNPSEGFQGAVFPAGRASWTEIWAANEHMPETTMLHVIVDDADAYANRAKDNGITVSGPMDMHGERIYFSEGPGGLPIAVLSKVTD
jgi:predicted enzyme related to lactoylglutathione lyase